MPGFKLTDLEHRKIMRQLSKLAALEAGGVDNWDGCDDSLAVWRKEGEVSDLIDGAIGELNDILAESDVEQPAGPGAGYNIHMPEADVRKMLVRLMGNYRDIMSTA